MAVTMLSSGMTPCGFCKNRCFRRTFHLHQHGEKNQRAGNVTSNKQLLVTAKVVPSSLIIFTLIMDAIHSTETLVLTRTTRRHIPEDGILCSHCRENLKSYIALSGWAL
jgi:hypothetical protein